MAMTPVASMDADLELIDKLAERDARVRMVSRMLPSGKLTDELRSGVLSDVKAYCAQEGITQAQLANETGVSTSYISPLLRQQLGELPASKIDDHVRHLNNWHESHHSRKNGVSISRPQMTKVLKRGVTVAKNLIVMLAMGCIYGPAGIGKTVLCTLLLDECPGAILLTANRGCHTSRTLLEKLHQALHSRRGGTLRKTHFDIVVARLKDSRRLIIIDQAHRLCESGIEMAMDIHDATGCPVLFVGTIKIRDRVDADADPFFGQLSSRIAIRKNLLPEIGKPASGGRCRQWVGIDDIRKIFHDQTLKLHRDAAQLLCELANSSIGHIRRVGWIYRWAAALARVQGDREISLRHVHTAMRQSEGQDDVQALRAIAIMQRERSIAHAAS